MKVLPSQLSGFAKRIALPGLAGLLLFSSLPAKDPKISKEELVQRHLESLGSQETLANWENCQATGTGVMTIRLGGTGRLNGDSALISEGNKLSFRIGFSVSTYPEERFVFDGEKVTVGNIRPGVRSPLGQFLHTHDVLLKEGLLGGVLSTGWPLRNVEIRQPKLDYEGRKKVADQEVHELKYRMKRGGSDIRIALYFDTETFRHLRSVYRITISASMGATPELSSRQLESRFTLEETFSDFREVRDLTLPSRWTMELTQEAGRGTFLATWEMNFSDFQMNVPLNSESFQLNN